MGLTPNRKTGMVIICKCYDCVFDERGRLLGIELSNQWWIIYSEGNMETIPHA
jgi:hypothetical protein